VRLVFLGTPEVAVPTLRALVGRGHEVVLVVTRPDRPAGRSGRPVSPPVKRAAEQLGLAVHQPTRVRGAAFADELGSHRPDLLVVVAYGRILPGAVLRLAPSGAINLHFSLLPAYRGAAPVQWALANGEKTTGVTTMQISEGLDEGDVLIQREVGIHSGEHAPALQERLASIGAELTLQTLEALEAGTLVSRPQQPSMATYAPLLTAADGEIDMRWTAREIVGRIRGFDPWPGAWVANAARRLRLVEADCLDDAPTEAGPGQVLELSGEGLVVACGGGTRLSVTRLQSQGRRVMTARDAVNGRHLRPGDRLGRPGSDRRG